MNNVLMALLAIHAQFLGNRLVVFLVVGSGFLRGIAFRTIPGAIGAFSFRHTGDLRLF